MKKSTKKVFGILILIFTQFISYSAARTITDFDKDWKFNLGDISYGQNQSLDDTKWRTLNLPHDWSVEGAFSDKHPATTGGGALPGGIGWYRKSFSIPETDKNKNVFIDFDGVYYYSEVWLNGHYLGLWENGYLSFRYDLTPYLKYGNEKNIIAVKVDNSRQQNSRWYSGSGIYRNVWLVTTEKVFIDHWGTFVTTPSVKNTSAQVSVKTKIRNTIGKSQSVILNTILKDANGKEIARKSTTGMELKDSIELTQALTVLNPNLWSVENPYLYKTISQVIVNNKIYDEYETPIGIRYFVFDINKGFLLNDKPVKINGVCNHHDLGSLGSAINTRALERQLEILKGMGCNGIRTSHNPPAPELLDLCDKMGFIVMDEAFDMWKLEKTKFDYSVNWDRRHKRDLQDQLKRDRNHPSVFIWSIGNEIREQWDSTGFPIAKELGSIVKDMDTTRPVTSACNEPTPRNYIIKSGALDLIGFNYHHQDFGKFKETFPGKKFIATETVSSLQTRGHYDNPSDSIRIWPEEWDKPFDKGNKDFSCSAYDNCHAPWGSTHEETWKVLKKHDFLSGSFIWTGFDYLGEPTPYPWPARSSYFGIIDLAGFPKDVYYMYQSEWTDKTMLHIFPHWNWKKGDTIDIWAYYNKADEVELFLNGKSLGTKKKTGDELHVQWRVIYSPGILKAISRLGGKEVLNKEIKTAGKPAKLILSADRQTIKADGKDLSFVTVKVADENGILIPDAENLINFSISGVGTITSVDNGSPISHESFKVNYRKAFNGLALAIIQAQETGGIITLTATSDKLEATTITINVK